MCCRGQNGPCVTLNKSRCKCLCAKCRRCGECGRETIGKAGNLFKAGAGGSTAARFQSRRRSFSVSSDTSDSSPEGADSSQNNLGVDPMHIPTRYSRSASVSGTTSSEASPKPIHIPTRYARSVSLSEEPLETEKPLHLPTKYSRSISDQGRKRLQRSVSTDTEGEESATPPPTEENLTSLTPVFKPSPYRRTSRSMSTCSTDSQGASLARAANEECTVQ